MTSDTLYSVCGLQATFQIAGGTWRTCQPTSGNDSERLFRATGRKKYSSFGPIDRNLLHLLT